MRQPRRGRASSDRQPAAGQRHLHSSRPECLSHFRRAEHRPVRFPPGWRGTLPPAASRAHAKTRVYRRGGANRHFAAPLPTGGARLLETTVPRNSTACVCAAATPGCCCGSVCGPVCAGGYAGGYGGEEHCCSAAGGTRPGCGGPVPRGWRRDTSGRSGGRSECECRAAGATGVANVATPSGVSGATTQLPI